MSYARITGSERSLTTGARVVGRVSPGKTIQVTVHIRSSSDPTGQGLKAFATSLVSQEVRGRQHLSRADYATAYGVKPADVQKVRKFAREYKLRIVPDRVAQKTKAQQSGQRTVELRGKTRAFNRAFGVKLIRVHDAGRVYRTYQGSIGIPDGYQDVIENVLGLDERPQVKPRFRRAHRLGGNTPHAQGAAYSPDQIAKLYNFPAGVTGKGQTIALIEFGGGARLQDLKTYFAGLGIPQPKVKFVSVGRGSNKPTGNPNSSDGEVMLDVEVAGAVAPGATIVFYFAPNTNRGFFRAINAAVQDNVNNPTIISISWGGPEGTWTSSDMTSIDEAFQAAAAIGISVFVAAGDNGSTDGVQGSVAHVDFPASSPFATGCGGTSLNSSGGTTTEQVWNDGASGGGTGGGISDVFPVPTYQQSLRARLTSVNPGGHVGRGVPDVAGNADPNTGYKVRIDGVNSVLGGTSAVAPLWAGLFALINESLGKSAGFANSLLYSSYVAGVPGSFRDITQGNNDTTGLVKGYSAAVGWDPCTGLGTPANGTQILNGIKSMS
jgi:kumamolisin